MRVRLAAIPAVVLGAGVGPWWTCGLPWDRPSAKTAAEDQPLGNANESRIPTSPAYQLGHREETSPPEQRPPAPVLSARPLRIPEAAVVHALDLAQPALLGCFHRAQHVDPTLTSAKININLFVDTMGHVMSVRTDVSEPKFNACLTNVTRRLTFPPPSGLAVADLTFLAW